MNTTPTMMPPTRAVDAKAGSVRDAGAAETPFSQVLSGEMANQSNAQAVREDAGQAVAEGGAPALVPAADPALPPAVLLSELQTGVPARPGVGPVAPDATLLLGMPLAPTLQPAPQPTAVPQADTAQAAVLPGMPGPASARPAPPGTAAAGAQPHAAAAPAAAHRPEPAVPGKAAPLAASAAAEAARAASAPLQEGAQAAPDGRFEQLLPPAMREAAAPPERSAEAPPSRLAPAVGSSAWSQALGDRVVWMASAGQQTATLTLNPPNLGPLQVVLNLANDQASASFYAVQPEVRQAIESAFPRLREMMNEAGIQLGQATVFAEASPQQRDEAAGHPGRGHAQRLGTADEAPLQQAAGTIPLRAGRGLIDTFA